MFKNTALIGYTGFVGSNLASQFQFNDLYNSKNIDEIKDKEYDLVVCSGVSAVKWLANQEPDNDFNNIEQLKKRLVSCKIKHLVLISTVDIYDNPNDVDEDTIPDVMKQDYYGKHRYQLEQWASVNPLFQSVNIIRLPGLFGQNLKKNLIFDIMNPLAKSINKALWFELSTKLTSESIKYIEQCYTYDEFGNLQLNHNISNVDYTNLVEIFKTVNFSTLNFTDSQSIFQFYNLANLWHDINYAIKHDYKVMNLACEPISAAELVKYLTKNEYMNHTSKGPVSYNMLTKYADNKYWYSKEKVLEQIKKLVEGK